MSKTVKKIYFLENNIVVSLEYKYYELMKFYDECKNIFSDFKERNKTKC